MHNAKAAIIAMHLESVICRLCCAKHQQFAVIAAAGTHTLNNFNSHSSGLPVSASCPLKSLEQIFHGLYAFSRWPTSSVSA